MRKPVWPVRISYPEALQLRHLHREGLPTVSSLDIAIPLNPSDSPQPQLRRLTPPCGGQARRQALARRAGMSLPRMGRRTGYGFGRDGDPVSARAAR